MRGEPPANSVASLPTRASSPPDEEHGSRSSAQQGSMMCDMRNLHSTQYRMGVVEVVLQQNVS